MSSSNSRNQRRAFMHLLGRVSGSALLAGTVPLSRAGAAGKPTLHGFRLARQENLQLYFDLDGAPADYRLFALSNPDRLVIDLYGVQVDTSMKVAGQHGDVVKNIRYASHADGKLRIVMDLLQNISYKHHLIGRSNGGRRLIVDLGVPATGGDRKAIKTVQDVHTRQLRKIVIAIDAGHGGKDPGAIGPNKTREKDITLAIARRLHKRLSLQEAIQPVLIRKKDEFLSLRERTRRARKAKADLFVSLHADAFRDKRAKGASVYVLSLKGASSEAAQWLADKENSVDLFGDVSLDGRAPELRETLLDLAQNATLESSLSAGDFLLDEMRRFTSLHKSRVEMANFAVLRSPDIPSVLIETAFLTNPDEERKLRSAKHQERLASAMSSALMAYFKRKAPPGTILASRLATRSG